MLSTLPLVWMTLVGAALGSTVALMVVRLPRGVSLLWPASRCDLCAVPLAWRDKLPVVSYLRLAGRCRRCGGRIGARALTCELMMAGVALALALRPLPAAAAAAWLPALAMLLAAALIDIDYWWVPDQLVGPAGAWLLACAWLPGMAGIPTALAGLLPAAGLAALGAAWSRVRGVHALGWGDVKMLAALGLGLGPWGAAVALLLAALQGLAVGLGVWACGGHPAAPPGPLPAAILEDADWTPPPGAIPFAPFLLLGGLEVLLLQHLGPLLRAGLGHLAL